MIYFVLTYTFAVIVSIFILILGIIYFYIRNQFKYWVKRNVPHLVPSFPLGSLSGIMKDHSATVFKKLYNHGKQYPYFGIWLFHKPSLMMNDPNLIKQILISDFEYFHDRGIYYNKKSDPLSANLVTQSGREWKRIRGKLSPAYTSGKLKEMLPIMIKYGQEMEKILREHAKNEELVEMVDVATRYTTDVICACAFGIEANSLKNSTADIRKMGQKIFGASSSASIRNLTAILAPKLAEFFQISVNSKEVSNYFFKVFREVLYHRVSTNEKSNDIFGILMQLNNEGFTADGSEEDQKLTFEEMVAQASIFLIGGFETSALTIQYALYELSRYSEIQEKVRNEICNTLKNFDGKLTFESINKMEYLGRVIDETLRKYPPTPGLIRTATKPYKVPNTSLTIEKGTPIIISTLGIHMDEKYYPNPEIFDPDRFTEIKKVKRDSCTYLAFGEGPRICIGQRFALLEVKVGLISLICNFKFHLPDANASEPLEFDPKATLLVPKNGMHLKISSLDNK